MKIAEIILKSVNNFDDFHWSFEDEWTEDIPSVVMVMGPNGSGKTTMLKVVAGLWLSFGGFIENKRLVLSNKYSIFLDCDLAAIRIQNFLLTSTIDVWIYLGKEDAVIEFTEQCQGTHRISGIPTNQDKDVFEVVYTPPDILKKGDIQKEHPWLDSLRNRFFKNRFGDEFDLPNIVFLESETRVLSEITEEFSAIPDKKSFNWLSRYRATTNRKGHLENYLFTLKAINEPEFQSIVQAINRFLVDKQITEFDQSTAELMVETKSGGRHPLHLLSSGEKQILLMITFITRELQNGGVLLIDEPGLHLHISLSGAYVDYLKHTVINKNGQLIIASHAPELWDRFTQSQRVELGALETLLP
ncbi:ATP-binding protein [Anaerolineales bacterium HSG6]|nr:ATP-binding protein [Anaerolineales bacterium HSG6]